ncbi:MAG: hypothetical protein LPK20_16620 [Halomonas sp.]|jgi:hypothetical protein|uniref:Uncharacterized protein n=1 Tax=Billgrantia tianxiuensis TaxID=2497861 RepID=A0A6I6SJ57_9GAMM|nr:MULTISPECIES: hypothetical protein [Halomonas]MCE8035044.1 hypothetical protein [Halomonas sp. MCCC 1A11057]MDX5435182.1 hypothetical protein [Halomonas sp.]QHC48454.1 hypothetical protein EKK97_00980 [Halomonas tianxiuensis]
MRIELQLIRLWFIRKVEAAGYHLQSMKRFRPVDARSHEGNPLLLSYRHPGRRLLLNAPVAWGFGLLNFPFDRPRPLAAVMQRALSSPGQERALIREALTHFYRDWQPRTAAEFFGLDEDEAGELAALPTWLSPWPWDPLTLEQKRAQRRRTEGRENARVLGRPLGVEAGWKFCGPVSELKLHVEVERLARVLESVRIHGIRRHDGTDGDIRAIVLSHPDGRWRWQVLAGQHRYAVISALGEPRIPIRVEHFVRREDVLLWPGVASGLFKPSAALKVFDDCFSERVMQPVLALTEPCLPYRNREGAQHEVEADTKRFDPGLAQ